jgi:16S rRNA (guanine966-N2)-methyltransferase
MRIIAGRHRGRRLAAPTGPTARPTADRARQALFNILAHTDLVELEGAVVMDAFAGTGALGLEALSRGAAHAVFMDNNGGSLAAIHANIAMLGEQARATVLSADAATPPKASRPCTLALLDPPYHSGLVGPCLEGLARQGWLTPDALAVVEVASAEPFTPPAGFATVDERVYGAARLVFVQATTSP